MSRILTGIQSSGRPHLGNILGAIKPAIDLSKVDGNESFLFIADLHSLTTIKDGSQRREFTKAVAATWLAFGLDTAKNTFWRQSRVAEHTELCWYLDCFTPMPMLNNATSFKEKSDRYSNVNAGLFVYPVLQAADILLYDAEIIPVGKDQRQHIEMTRDIAGAFNREYNDEVFTLPEPRIDERLMTIPGLDGQKMSKSYNNYIDIFLPKNELWKVIKKIKSDSKPMEEPKNPDTDITFQLYSLLAHEFQTGVLKAAVENEKVLAMRDNYEGGNYGYGMAKEALYELIIDRFSAERKRFNYYYHENPDALEDELQKGEEKARTIAREKIRLVREKLGFN